MALVIDEEMSPTIVDNEEDGILLESDSDDELVNRTVSAPRKRKREQSAIEQYLKPVHRPWLREQQRRRRLRANYSDHVELLGHVLGNAALLHRIVRCGQQHKQPLPLREGSFLRSLYILVQLCNRRLSRKTRDAFVYVFHRLLGESSDHINRHIIPRDRFILGGFSLNEMFRGADSLLVCVHVLSSDRTYETTSVAYEALTKFKHLPEMTRPLMNVYHNWVWISVLRKDILRRQQLRALYKHRHELRVISWQPLLSPLAAIDDRASDRQRLHYSVPVELVGIDDRASPADRTSFTVRQKHTIGPGSKIDSNGVPIDESRLLYCSARQPVVEKFEDQPNFVLKFVWDKIGRFVYADNHQSIGFSIRGDSLIGGVTHGPRPTEEGSALDRLVIGNQENGRRPAALSSNAFGRKIHTFSLYRDVYLYNEQTKRHERYPKPLRLDTRICELNCR